MPIQYTNIVENDFGRGIDARSTENQITEGFVKDLLNADVIQRSVRKRTGYQSYAGNMPVRVTKVEYQYNASPLRQQMYLTLDSAVALDTAVSLEYVRSSPLVIYGRLSDSATGTGPLTTSDSPHYYPKFFVPIRKELVAPSGTLLVPGEEHGLGSTDFFCNLVQSTNLLNKSYEDVDINSVTIDNTTYDISLNYDTLSDIDAIIYYKNQASVPGDNYITTLSHTGSGLESFSIPTTLHNLINYNIVYQIYEDVGTGWQQVIPNEFLLDNNGDVTVSLAADSATTYKIILSAAPTTNTATGIANASSTGTVQIANVESPWIFYTIYLEQTPGGTKEEVKAESIVYDDTTKTITLTFINRSPASRNFIVLYEYGDIRSNVLGVEDVAVTADGFDMRPQVTIWGLDHDEIYTTKAAREGWTNHIDTYRRSGEQRLIAGLGGNLFSAQTYGESAASHLYPLLYPSLQSRTDAALNVGPVFYDTGDDPKRTRGYITTDIGGTGWVTVTSVEYDDSNSWTKYTLSVPNMSITGSPISTAAGLEDWITIQQMSYARHNGTFRIRQVDDTISDQLTIWVENTSNSSDYDDSNTGGRAGIFTDQITWIAPSSYIPGDTIQLLGEDLADIYTSTNNGIYTSVVGPFDGVVQVPAGVLITGKRTSAVVPTREGLPSLADSVVNAVRGDMLSYPGLARQMRILSINADVDRSVSISGDGTTATVTMLAGNTSFLSGGQKIILISAGNYSGVHTVSNILSTTEFTFDTTHSDTVPLATLSGKTIEIDEDLTWNDTSGDSTFFRCERRWIPIEAPDDMFELTPTTYVRHFDTDSYSDQSFIRSTMVSDNLYLTNGRDEVMKFDGQNIYRAGLPAWQPALFVTQSVNPQTRTCTISSGSDVITTVSTAGIELGAIATDGTAIPAGATVTQIISNTQFRISVLAVGNATTDVSFTIPRVVVDLKQIGYKAKIAAAGTLELNHKYETSVLPIGTNVRISGSTSTYTIAGYETDTNHIIFDRSLDSSVAATGTVTEIGTYKYYFRLNAVDANDNIIASAMTSSDDMSIEMTDNAAIHLKLVGLPAFDNYDYDRIEVQIYRTKLLTGSQAPVFYLITTLPLDFDKTSGYIEYTDTFADSDLYELDVTSSIAGAELGIGWSDPLRAKYITTTSNRLVLGNVRDYPEIDLRIVGPATLSNTELVGDTVLLRKDSADTDTSSNMTDRVKFEWVSSNGTAITGFSGIAGTSFTMTVANTAAPGDWVYLYYSSVATTGRLLKYAGWWQIASRTPTTITINYTGTDLTTTSHPDRAAFASTAGTVPVVLGADGNLGQLNGDTFDIFDATRRLALAINAVMRQTDISLVPDFRPWLSARSGNDLSSAGQIIIRSSGQVDVLPSAVVTFSGYSVFINSVQIASGSNVPAVQKVFPSRVLVSYQNYPELFDSPTAILDSDSISAIDINPADGQEITGVIPFFGETAFTAAQQAGVLVVFKTNSIYLVDINQKVSGSNLVVQRLETQGLGCTAPYSIAVTKNGIMFANNSGMYCLRRDQSIEYIGKFMERNWTGRIDSNALDIAHGHHYGVGRMYKLSIPLKADRSEETGYIQPNEVYVYNHTQEDEENHLGAWSRYDSHTAVGWANLASDAFWASTGGNVYVLRATGLESDFRDSNRPISFRLDTRPNSYGNSGIRKILDKIVASYRTGTATASNTLSFSVDLEQEYSPTTAFRIAGTGVSLNGMSDIIGKDIITLRHSLDRRKGVYFSIRIENSNLDQNVEVAGLDYRVGGLDSKGILSASKT